MNKLMFTIKATGAEVTLFILDPEPPHQGGCVPLEREDSTWVGEKELDPGVYGYILHIRAGLPSSQWSLSIQRGSNPPLQRKGQLNDQGSGGRIAEITLP
jgi:hypothetical protein